MESLLAHPGPTINPQASENPPGTEVTPSQVMDVESSTFPWKCSPVPFESPCPRAIHTVTVALPGPSHLLPCAVPTGVDPSQGTAGRLPGGLAVCSSISFPLLVLSLVHVSAVARGTLGWLSHHSGRRLVPQQRELPSCQGSGHGVPTHPACGVRARAPCVCHVCVSTVCLLCALHAWAGLCDLLSSVHGRTTLGSAWGWGQLQQAFLP